MSEAAVPRICSASAVSSAARLAVSWRPDSRADLAHSAAAWARTSAAADPPAGAGAPAASAARKAPTESPAELSSLLTGLGAEPRPRVDDRLRLGERLHRVAPPDAMPARGTCRPGPQRPGR